METTIQEQEVDVVVVGGGPCGLALALGLLQQQHYSVLVIEKDEDTTLPTDWSKAYSYRVDVRGLHLLKSIGVQHKLVERGVKSEGFKGVKWHADGRLEELPPRTLGSVGYWIQRPSLLQLLEEELSPENILRGTVSKIQFDDECAAIHVFKASGDTLVVKARHVFGCDGIHSIVRSTLAEIDKEFQVHKVACPSAGVSFRASLVTPPLSFDPHDTFLILGKTSGNLSLLPYCGERGEPRPLATARLQDDKLFQAKNADDLYDMLDQEFPQLNVRQCMSVEAATAWSKSKGSIFPTPRWIGKAVKVMNSKIIVAIMGDALHSFPPDLGQGVNSGMADVNAVLDAMDKQRHSDTLPDKDMNALNATLVEEAEALCRLLPIGMPYQYKLPHSLEKFVFFTNFMIRWGLAVCSAKLTSLTRGWIPLLLTEPVIMQIQHDPPLKYTMILKNHRRNTWILSSFAVAVAGLGWKMLRASHRLKKHKL